MNNRETAMRGDRLRVILSAVTLAAVAAGVFFQFQFIQTTGDMIRLQDATIAQLRLELDVEKGFLDATRRALSDLQIDLDKLKDETSE